MKIIKKWRGIFLLLAAMAGINILFSYFTFNNEEKLAKELFTLPHGELNERVFTAAINARFQPGSNAGEFIAFVERIGGHCNQRNGALDCVISRSGTICMTSSIELNALISVRNEIQSIETRDRLIAC